MALIKLLRSSCRAQVSNQSETLRLPSKVWAPTSQQAQHNPGSQVQVLSGSLEMSGPLVEGKGVYPIMQRLDSGTLRQNGNLSLISNCRFSMITCFKLAPASVTFPPQWTAPFSNCKPEQTIYLLNSFLSVIWSQQ